MSLFRAKIVIVALLLFLVYLPLGAQDFDYQMVLSNSINWSKIDWRYKVDYQIRLKDNVRNLDRQLFEFVGTYMPSRSWELVPDFRISFTDEIVEYRPGFGVIYKIAWGEKIFVRQLVNQVKYQADIEENGKVKHGLRYVLFYNHLITKELLFSSGAAFFYRWQEDYTGFQFFRAVTGLVYIFDSTHTLSISPYFGIEDPLGEISFLGGVMIGFTIRLRDKSKYLPARYISF